MDMSRRTLVRAAAAAPVAAAAAGGLPWRSARAQAANTIKLGVLVDLSGMYRDVTGQVSVAAARQAVQDFGPRGFNVEVLAADQQNKPRCRGERRAAMVRPRRGGLPGGCRHLLGLAGGERHLPREEQGPYEQLLRHLGPDGEGLHAEHRALGVRHLHAGQLGRRRHGAGGRRHLVLHRRRLRLRPCAGARHGQLRPRRRRKGAGQRAHALPGHRGFFFVPGAGAGERRQGDRPGQCRRRHHQLRQAGLRVRAEPARHPARLPAAVHHRGAFARPAHGAGADRERELLLGPQRPHPRLCRALASADRHRRDRQHPCRDLRQHAALPQGGGRHGRGGRQGFRGRGGGAHEGDADRRRLLRPGQHPCRTGARSTPPISSR